MIDNKNPDHETGANPCGSKNDTGLNESGPVLKILKFFIIISNILVAVLVSSAAIMRYLLKIDLYGVDEFILLSAYILYFSGAVYGAHQGQHICADILSNYLKSYKLKSMLKVVNSFITLALSLVFSWLGVKMFAWQWMTQGKTQVWRIPIWASQGFIALCLILMSVYFLLWFIKSVKQLRYAMVDGSCPATDDSVKE